MPTRIAVGSTSLIKVDAVREALFGLGMEVEVVSASVPSGVSEQPRENETVLGARNRAAGAREAFPGAWAVGIESGIFDEGKNWSDRGVICLISPTGDTHVVRTEGVTLYVRDVEEARRRGFDRTTIGSVMAERTGCDPADPHAMLFGGGKSRRAILQVALATLFREFMLTPESHRVHVCGQTLCLPVVAVNDDVSVALFNPLGDWALTETLGEALELRTPDDVEALVMPDGKAQALLHVMGRRLNLPTFVARKELKPYMRDAVSAQTVSITSGRRQTLYLDGRDAQRLRGKRVAVVDDVISTGSTLDAVTNILEQVGAKHVATMAVFTEGDAPRIDVISLGHLPLFRRNVR